MIRQDKIIVEVRVNEFASRQYNKSVPWSPEEIAADAKACYDAGASVIHYHGRQPNGEQCHELDFFVRTNRLIREACPILIHPTLGCVANEPDALSKLQLVDEMMLDPRGAPDLVPTNVTSVGTLGHCSSVLPAGSTELLYRCSDDVLEQVTDKLAQHGLTQYLVSWNVSCTRHINRFLDAGLIPEPAFLCFMLSEGGALSGHPVTPEGLQAHLIFLPKDKNIEWTVACHDGDLFQITDLIIKAGGHVSIGLGDHPYSAYGEPTNAQLVEWVVAQARELGREPASVEETRALLGMSAESGARTTSYDRRLHA